MEGSLIYRRDSFEGEGLVERVVHFDFSLVLKEFEDFSVVADTNRIYFLRSVVKPLITVAYYDELVKKGIDLGELSDEELAVASASHSGEKEHILLVNSILQKAGLNTSYLMTPESYPIDELARAKLRAYGLKPERIYHNCSGKHAMALYYLKKSGLGNVIESYLKSDDTYHPVEMLIEKLDEKFVSGVDGCGFKNWAFSSVAFLRWLLENFNHRVLKACRRNPKLVGGTNRVDTLIMKANSEKVLAKTGAASQIIVVTESVGVYVKSECATSNEVGYIAIKLLEKFVSVAMPSEIDLCYRNGHGEVVGEVELNANL